MQVHIIAGEMGCRCAVEWGAAVVVVDALRASATAAALLDAGVTAICFVREVEDAFLVRESLWPDALLVGERHGLPPKGFDFGNSPQEAMHAKGRRVIFTTTTGALRLLDAYRAPLALMGTVVNCRAVLRFLRQQCVARVVLVPAGLAGDPHFDAQEDWVAAAWIARCLAESTTVIWGEGIEKCHYYWKRLDNKGLLNLFQSAPHAQKLRSVGMESDVAFCAQADLYDTVPVVVEEFPPGLIVKNAPVMRE